MKVTEEAGVLARSERFFATPGTVARGLFYYITRAGHYYYDENYDFRDNCEIAHLESHRNFYLLYVRAGTMCVHTDHEFSVERGQAALVDCRRPHRFFTHGDAEALWLHFDGANSGAFFVRPAPAAARAQSRGKRRSRAGGALHRQPSDRGAPGPQYRRARQSQHIAFLAHFPRLDRLFAT